MKIKVCLIIQFFLIVVPIRILGIVELDRPKTFSDQRLVDGFTTEVS